VTAAGQGPTRRGDTEGLAGTTCVVTGGLGFIGSNLVHRLAAEGAEVRVVDALVPDHGGDVRNVAGLEIEVVVSDIGAGDVAAVLDGADVVFNLAGQVSHTSSMSDPEKDLLLNTVTHARFLETLRRVNPDARVVHASTRQVYGRALRVPVDEEHPANPVDVNGAAKLAGEHLHLVYARAHAMPITSLRLTNVYGPRQRLTSDGLGFLPVFVRRVLLGEPISLFGDGSQRRDCLHVDDVVDAMLASVDDVAVGRVYNVGNDIDHSLAEIAEIAVRVAGSASTISRTEWPADHQRIDIGSFRSDSGLIAREVGWKASVGLEEGFRGTFAFYREHPWYLSST
jgi:UDP-glucose 4-epimerase